MRHLLVGHILIGLILLSLTSCIPGLEKLALPSPPSKVNTNAFCEDLEAVILFPDPVLSQAVQNTLSLIGPEEITCSKLLKLKRLTVASAQGSIEDLTGLENAFILNKLDLKNHSVSDLSPLAGLEYLSDLNLSGNSITDLTPLARLEALSKLELDQNQLSSLAGLEALPLVQLSVNENLLTDLSPLASLTTLSTLEASQNLIKAPAGLPNSLQNLVLEQNQISDLRGLSSLSNLQNLSLEENPISNLAGLRGALEPCKP